MIIGQNFFISWFYRSPTVISKKYKKKSKVIFLFYPRTVKKNKKAQLVIFRAFFSPHPHDHKFEEKIL